MNDWPFNNRGCNGGERHLPLLTLKCLPGITLRLGVLFGMLEECRHSNPFCSVCTCVYFSIYLADIRRKRDEVVAICVSGLDQR